MATEVFTGQVLGLSQISAGTPASFCRELTGGSLTIDSNNVVKPGAGGQRHVRRGTVGVRLDFTCIAPAMADLALWFPTTAVSEVASFPDMLVEVDDGSGGIEFVLTTGQPATVSIDCAEGEDAEAEYSFSAMYRFADDQAYGTDVAVYNAFVGHTINDITAQVAAADQGILSFSLSNDLGAEAFNPMDTKVAAYRTQPLKYIVTRNDPRLSFVTSNPLDATAWYGTPTHTARDLTFAFANGTVGEDIGIELDEWVPQSWNMPFEAEGKIGFAHEFVPGDGTNYNRVIFT